MASEMVERVARAMLARRFPGTRPEDILVDQSSIEDARAVIEAMRPTTKAMRLAMNPANGPDYVVGDPDDVWSAAIDAALEALKPRKGR